METVAFRTARHGVHLYREEFKRFRKAQRSLVGSRAVNYVAGQHEAIERRDCEDCLQLGIEAFHWLQRARLSYQEDVYSGQSEYDDGIERRLTDLYEQWLKPRDAAERWIVDLQRCGFPPGNTGEFRQSSIEVAAVLEERRMVEAARRARSQDSGDET